MDTNSKTSMYLSQGGKNLRVLDEAWDVFMDYLGDNGITTTLTHQQFETIFSIVDKEKKFLHFKDQILYSFQNDSGAWPLVERERR